MGIKRRDLWENERKSSPLKEKKRQKGKIRLNMKKIFLWEFFYIISRKKLFLTFLTFFLCHWAWIFVRKKNLNFFFCFQRKLSRIFIEIKFLWGFSSDMKTKKKIKVLPWEYFFFRSCRIKFIALMWLISV